jgi:hypothetical protein
LDVEERERSQQEGEQQLHACMHAIRGWQQPNIKHLYQINAVRVVCVQAAQATARHGKHGSVAVHRANVVSSRASHNVNTCWRGQRMDYVPRHRFQALWDCHSIDTEIT